MAMLEEAAAKRLYEEVERVTVRSERLQQQLDKERAVNDSLRAQLRNAAAVQQQLNVQIRGVTGSSAGARSLQTAGGGGLGNVTLMGLQRKVDALHNRIDVEKRAANAERAEKIRLPASHYRQRRRPRTVRAGVLQRARLTASSRANRHNAHSKVAFDRRVRSTRTGTPTLQGRARCRLV